MSRTPQTQIFCTNIRKKTFMEIKPLTDRGRIAREEGVRLLIQQLYKLSQIGISHTFPKKCTCEVSQ